MAKLHDKFPNLRAYFEFLTQAKMDAASPIIAGDPTLMMSGRAKMLQHFGDAIYLQMMGRGTRPGVKPDLPSKRSRKRDHAQAIAHKCEVQAEQPDNLTTVLYRGHMALYDMSGERPKFIVRNDLANPEEPRKTVQDGMRLAAVWHKHPERKPKAAPTISKDGVQWRKMYDGNPVMGLDLAKPGGDTTILWYTADRPAKPAKTKTDLDFADVDEGDGRLLSPDSFVWTPEMYRLVGAGKNMGDLLALWHAMANAARWNPK